MLVMANCMHVNLEVMLLANQYEKYHSIALDFLKGHLSLIGPVKLPGKYLHKKIREDNIEILY